MPVATASSPGLYALQSIATVAGVVALHALAVAIVRQRKTSEAGGTTLNQGTRKASSSEKSCKEKLIGDFPTCVVITLPEWTDDFYNQRKDKVYKSEAEMMQVAMELSKINVQMKTGGPFGTAIFEYDPSTDQCTLFSIGVNRVVPLGNSTLHGEMTAIQFGQQKIGNFSFSSAGSKAGKEYHLYTSCAPCCQCLGATMWSGVSKLVCGATKDDAEAIGFSEGPVFDPQSYDALEDAGCRVVRDVLREECKEVLDWYGRNGEIYNP